MTIGCSTRLWKKCVNWFALSGLVLFSVSSSCLQAPADLNSQIDSNYGKKILILRGYPIGESLHYNSQGAPKSRYREGSWTVSELTIEKIKIGEHLVEIQGPRIGLIFDRTARKLTATRLKAQIHLTLDRDSNQPDSSVMDALAKVFMTEDQITPDTLPIVWRNFMSNGYEFVPQQNGSDCYRLSGIGFKNSAGEILVQCEDRAQNKLTSGQKELLMLLGVRPFPANSKDVVVRPHQLYAPTPDYEPIAKEAGFEGTSVLEVSIQEDGSVSNISIKRPCGLGLDERAVDAVSRWRLSPALVNDRPETVRTDIEVNFILQ